MDVLSASKVSRIRELNDSFRRSFMGGRVYLTSSVAALEDREKMRVLEAVRTFTNFTEDNDPYGEHDFVSVEVDGETYFAKIDYYAPDLQHGSEDPANPAITKRVMTILHSSEY